MQEKSKPVYYRKYLFTPSEETKSKIIYWDFYKKDISYDSLMAEILVCPEIVKDCNDEFINDDIFALELALKAPRVRMDIPLYRDNIGFRKLVSICDRKVYFELMQIAALYCNNIIENGSIVPKNILKDFSKIYVSEHGLKNEKKMTSKNTLKRTIEILEDFYFISPDFRRAIIEEVVIYYSKTLLKPIIDINLKRYLQNIYFMSDVYLNDILFDKCVKQIIYIDRKESEEFKQRCQSFIENFESNDVEESLKESEGSKTKE